MFDDLFIFFSLLKIESRSLDEKKLDGISQNENNQCSLMARKKMPSRFIRRLFV